MRYWVADSDPTAPHRGFFLMFSSASSASSAVKQLTGAIASLRRRMLRESAQLLDRLRAVVHLETQHDVVVEPDAATLLHVDDEQRRGLLAAFVAPGALAGFERRDESEMEPAGRALERRDHRVHHAGPREDVPLRGAHVRSRTRFV